MPIAGGLLHLLKWAQFSPAGPTAANHGSTEQLSDDGCEMSHGIKHSWSPILTSSRREVERGQPGVVTVKEALVFLFLVLVVLIFFALGGHGLAVEEQIRAGGDTLSPRLASWSCQIKKTSAKDGQATQPSPSGRWVAGERSSE